MGNLKLLDCTFRDGGYYTNWDFDARLVEEYVSVMNHSGISNVEVGFRNFPDNKYRGAFYYCHDEYIRRLGFSEGIALFVMVDATSFARSSDVQRDVRKLFVDADLSPITGVRVATRLEDLNLAVKAAKAIKSLGYRVFLNIMQIAAESSDDIQSAIKSIDPSDVEVIYFADSLGEMTQTDIDQVVSVIRSGWVGEIGIHAHDNQGLGASNTVGAVKHGVTWLDGTIAGMGRGAGNAQTESLLLELPSLLENPKVIFNLAIAKFEPMKKDFGWGSSFLYTLAAKQSVHPTFVQQMLTQPEYPVSRVLEMLDYLATVNARIYDKKLLTFSKNKKSEYKGTWNAVDWCKGQEVLIIGGGESVDYHRDGIRFFIQTYNPLVIALSVKSPGIERDLINLYACANEAKMLSEGVMFATLDKPIAVPNLLLKQITPYELDNKKGLDYGVTILANNFQARETDCVIPSESTLAYVMAFCSIGNATRINLVGFDGFAEDDIRAKPMNDLLYLYQSEDHPDLVSLTPTSYHITKDSIYSLRCEWEGAC